MAVEVAVEVLGETRILMEVAAEVREAIEQNLLLLFQMRKLQIYILAAAVALAAAMTQEQQGKEDPMVVVEEVMKEV